MLKMVKMSDFSAKLPVEALILHYCADIRRLIYAEHWPVGLVIEVLVETGILAERCYANHFTKVLKTLHCDEGLQLPLPIEYDLFDFAKDEDVNVKPASHEGIVKPIKSAIVPVFERDRGIHQEKESQEVVSAEKHITPVRPVRPTFSDKTAPTDSVDAALRLVEEARLRTRTRVSESSRAEESEVQGLSIK